MVRNVMRLYSEHLFCEVLREINVQGRQKREKRTLTVSWDQDYKAEL